MTKDEPKKWKRNKMRQFSMGHITWVKYDIILCRLQKAKIFH